MPARTIPSPKKSSTSRRRPKPGDGEKKIQRGRPISRNQSWTQTLAETRPVEKTDRTRGMSSKLEDVLIERQTQQAPPAPLVKTTYNSRAVFRITAVGVIMALAACSWAAWRYHPWVKPAPALIPTPTTFRLTVPTQAPDQQRLNQLSAGQSSAAAAVSSTQSAQAYRSSLEPLSLPELATEIHSRINELAKQGIATDTVAHFAQRAEAEASQGKTDDAKQDYLDGLQLSQELQAVYDYYHPN